MRSQQARRRLDAIEAAQDVRSLKAQLGALILAVDGCVERGTEHDYTAAAQAASALAGLAGTVRVLCVDQAEALLQRADRLQRRSQPRRRGR